MLREVSSTNELRPGFIQSSYKKGDARSIVLLFDVKKGVVLPNHKHGQHQFGYTFNGEYDFLIGGKRYLAVARDSYHIEGGIYHSAVANTDYYSMDFKYIGSGPLSCPVTFDIIQGVVDEKGAKRGEVRFNEVSAGTVKAMLLQGGTEYGFGSIGQGLERIMVVSKNTTVEISGKPHQLDRMKIYKLDGEYFDLNVKIFDEDAEVFLYEI
jgi:hypothetical protein